MNNVLQLPFQRAGFNQTFKAILLSDTASLLTIAADNPFGGTPAYYGAIGRVAFVKDVLAGKFILDGKCLSQFDAAGLRKLIDDRASPSIVWDAFMKDFAKGSTAQNDPIAA